MNNQPIWNELKLKEALQDDKTYLPFDSNNVCIDSRKVNHNDIFIGLKGIHHDGGIFAESALNNGAAICLINQDLDIKDHPRIIKVQNSEEALVKMARFRRSELDKKTRIIGVTGSVGKTSTKELIALALKSAGSVYATIGNLNNHLGLPLSVVNIPNNINFCVLEMGMNHSGEISYLSNIARPEIAVVTNVGPVHLEFFDGIQSIALAKSEIFDYMHHGQFAIINKDDEYKDIIIEHAKKKDLMIHLFSEKTESDFRLIDYKIDDNKTIATVKCKNQTLTYHFPIIIGKHLVFNSLAAIAVAESLGLDIIKAANNMANFTPVSGRGSVQSLKNNMILIDDSYNASIKSIEACFETVNTYKTKDSRTIVILGDMKELGDNSINLHKNLYKTALEAKIDKIYTVGELMKNLNTALPDSVRGIHKDTSPEMAEIIINEIKPHDIIAVKGSFGMNMIQIVNTILKNFAK